MDGKREKIRNALFIGVLCSVSYLAVYFARNILGAVTAGMKKDGFEESFFGTTSSVYFISYAIGQLVNGAIGDKIKARYMISLGLLFAGISNFVFSLVARTPLAAYAAYACTGFFLAMIYGPMTKVVAENTEPIYATRCSLGYTFASFFGSPLAGVVATFTAWQSVFAISSAFLVAMAIACFVVFLVLEKKGIVKYGLFKPQKKTGGGNVKLLIKRRIITFSLVSILTGVVRTSVVFWLTLYITEYVGFSEKVAPSIYSAVTLIISFSAFIAIFVYELLKRNMNLTIFIMFTVSTLCFVGAYFVKQPVVNLVLIALAILASCCSSSMLWSRYCPSLYDTGMVSSATGFLDFLSYIAAAVASSLFAGAVDSIGWGNLILIWAGLMLLGIIIIFPSVFFSKFRTKSAASADSAPADSAQTEEGDGV